MTYLPAGVYLHNLPLISWYKWLRRYRRAKYEIIETSIDHWKGRHDAIAGAPSVLVPFAVDEATSAGEKDGTWQEFGSVDSDHLWPVRVWIPPWAYKLRVFFFWSIQFTSASQTDLRVVLGSANGDARTFQLHSYLESGEWFSGWLDSGDLTALRGTEQDFKIQWRSTDGDLGWIWLVNYGAVGDTAAQEFKYGRLGCWMPPDTYLHPSGL